MVPQHGAQNQAKKSGKEGQDVDENGEAERLGRDSSGHGRDAQVLLDLKQKVCRTLHPLE